MLISRNWLSEYIDLSDCDDNKISETLTQLGLEVEGLEKSAAFTDKVVVGEVLSAAPHPNAESLQVCQVSTGSEEPLTIVCGAPNARQGIKVAVATVGCTLPGDFKIKKSKIRGEASFGMLCSEQELEISNANEGIMELASDSKVGTPVVQILGLQDTVFEISLTPNRADCLGYIGIARDLAAKLGKSLIAPKPSPERSSDFSSEANIKVDVDSPDNCSRFVALAVNNVKNVSSPGWLGQRLQASGMRPINLIVDITNYVMLEYSQPIHAYDARDIKESTISVKAANGGERLTTLDETAREMVAGDIMICDGSGPIGLAGIMGGANSEVKEDTQKIIIEVASFLPTQIRKTARRLGLHTEASHRFERGTNMTNLTEVALRVAELLQICSKELGLEAPVTSKDIVDFYPAPISPRNIALRLERLKDLLALPRVTMEDAKQKLASLGFLILDNNQERLVVEVPAWRCDIEREVDLIEEVGRLIGFDSIDYQMPAMSIAPTDENPFISFLDDARLAAAACGLAETISFPFVSKNEMAQMNVSPDHPLYPSLKMANPISEEFCFMQTTLIPNLLRAACANRRHGEKAIKIFELARAYNKRHPDQTGSFWTTANGKDLHLTKLTKADKKHPSERHLFAGILDTVYRPKSWNASETRTSFYDAKQIIENFSTAMGIAVDFKAIEDDSNIPYLNPKRSAWVCINGKPIGYCGELHPRTSYQMNLGVQTSPIIFELDLELIHLKRNKSPKFESVIKRFPPLTRDMAFLVSKDTTHEDFCNAITKLKKRRHLQKWDLFDVYTGDNIPEEKKSLAYTFYFQNPERTLNDKEVEKEIATLTNWLSESIGAEQR